jgi:hypothetical protein
MLLGSATAILRDTLGHRDPQLHSTSAQVRDRGYGDTGRRTFAQVDETLDPARLYMAFLARDAANAQEQVSPEASVGSLNPQFI